MNLSHVIIFGSVSAYVWEYLRFSFVVDWFSCAVFSISQVT